MKPAKFGTHKRPLARNSAHPGPSRRGAGPVPASLRICHTVDAPQQDLGILGRLTPGQHHQVAEQTARDQVDDREAHSAMMTSSEEPAQIRLGQIE
jgi:hypothetical protein